MTAIEDGDGYKVISLKLNLTYEGTEITDQFTATGNIESPQILNSGRLNTSIQAVKVHGQSL